MRNKCVVFGEQPEARDSMAAHLRTHGVPVEIAASLDEIVALLKTEEFETALIVNTRKSDLAARKVRSQINDRAPGNRVMILTEADRGTKRRRFPSYRLGDYTLAVPELLGLLRTDRLALEESRRKNELDPGVRALTQVIDVLIGLYELGDRYFAGSSHRSMRLARAVAEEMGLDERAVHEIVLSTLLRDIGKVGIDPDLLESRESYSEEQMSEMQEHVTGSVRLLEHIDFPWKVLPIIRHHHEHYDGQGYPGGLKGPEIPLGARILAAVDAYVAMHSGRSHRPNRTSEHALAELERQAGYQFDPEVIEVLMRVVREKDVTLSADEKPRVLIADRDAEFLALLKLRLLNVGMDVQTLNNVDEAAVHLLDDPPALVLAGVAPDDQRAFDLLQALRGDDTLRQIPIAFIAAQADRILKVRAMRLGVDDFLAKTADLEELVARVENILIREASRRAPRSSNRRRGITGQLDSLPLPDIIQMLNMGMKTAMVSLYGENVEGRIWFDAGSAVHAETGGRTGAEAIYEMLRWKTGEFAIEHGIVTDGNSIETDTMFLVMEGLRMLDESAAGSSAA